MEISVWTTEREDALRMVTTEKAADEDEISPNVLDADRQKYKEMMCSLALRDATE